jgi:hypothetical protein
MAGTGPLRLPTDRHDTLWKLEPATAAKHRLYKKYLDAWWPILLQPSASTGRSWPHVTYVDALPVRASTQAVRRVLPYSRWTGSSVTVPRPGWDRSGNGYT